MTKDAGGLAGYRYGEGCRGPGLWIGSTRWAPRGVRKADYVRGGFYQLRLPLLAPSAPLVRAYQKGSLSFAQFARRYRREMAEPGPRQMIDLLALTARHTAVHVGCFCADESRCHRSLLLELIAAAGRRESGDGPGAAALRVVGTGAGAKRAALRVGGFSSPACLMAEIED